MDIIIKSYRLEADLYLRKPFKIKVLMSRFHAIIRRYLAEGMTKIDFEEGLTWNIEDRILTKSDGLNIELTSLQKKLFYLLVRKKTMGDGVLTYNEILSYLDSPDKAFNKHNLKELIYRSRKKMAEDYSTKDSIKIIKNKGLKLNLSIKTISY